LRHRKSYIVDIQCITKLVFKNVNVRKNIQNTHLKKEKNKLFFLIKEKSFSHILFNNNTLRKKQEKKTKKIKKINFFLNNCNNIKKCAFKCVYL